MARVSGALPPVWTNVEKWVWVLIGAIDIPRIFGSGKAVSGGVVVESRRVADGSRNVARVKLHNSQIVGYSDTDPSQGGTDPARTVSPGLECLASRAMPTPHRQFLNCCKLLL